jgi:hypothetical protein
LTAAEDLLEIGARIGYNAHTDVLSLESPIQIVRVVSNAGMRSLRKTDLGALGITSEPLIWIG